MFKKMLSKRTLNNTKTQKQIESEFESVRAAYLKDLNDLRAKYQLQFLSLSEEYKETCLLAR